MNRKRLLDLLKIVVSLVLIVVILRSIDVTILWQVIRHANPWYLATALAVSMVGVIVRAYRWQILVNDQGVMASLGELTALSCSRTFFPAGLVATRLGYTSFLAAANEVLKRSPASWSIVS